MQLVFVIAFMLTSLWWWVRQTLDAAVPTATYNRTKKCEGT